MTPYRPPRAGEAEGSGDRTAATPRPAGDAVELRVSEEATLVLDGRVIELLDAAGEHRRWHVAHVTVTAGPEEDGALLLEIAPAASAERRVVLLFPAARAAAALAFAEAVRRVRGTARPPGA